jgi:hypothetical protein
MTTYAARYTGIVQSKFNEKFSCVLEIWVSKPGDEPYLSSEVTSAAVFDTPEAAKDGAMRAIEKFDRDEMFPNMCEAF